MRNGKKITPSSIVQTRFAYTLRYTCGFELRISKLHNIITKQKIAAQFTP